MSTASFNRGLDDAANGELAKLGQDEDYYLAYYNCSYKKREHEPGPEQPEPTTEEYCEGYGHPFYAEDEDGSRCYCGKVTDFGQKEQKGGA